MTVIENGLWKAADVLDEKGFIKNHLQGGGGQVCALGAFNLAYGRKANQDGNSGAQRWAEREHADEMQAVSDTIKSLFPDRWSSSSTPATVLMSFNDNSATTKEDLAKVFRVAGVKLAVGI